MGVDQRLALPARAEGTGRGEEMTLESLLDQVVDLLADALARRLATLLEPQSQTPADGPLKRLLTMDELLAVLPAGKKPKTWKAWLYQHSRLGQVPGCHKIGGRLFFDADQTVAWILNSGKYPECARRLDLLGNQSLHAQPMPHQPTHGDRPGGGS